MPNNNRDRVTPRGAVIILGIIMLLVTVIFAIGGITLNISKIDTYFCPMDNCGKKIISLIDSADDDIVVSMYIFTHQGIRDALIRAQQRGVHISVLIDKKQSKGRWAVDDELRHAGIEILYYDTPYIMHHKFMVIDNKYVVTGSMNWSWSGDTNNNENFVIINDKKTVKEFNSEFDRLRNKVD